MYPLKFEKTLIKKVWGGRKFEEVLGFSIKDESLYGESWEVSTHNGGMSIVEDGEFSGNTLLELIQNYGEKILGEEVYKRFEGKFPVLIKYLDVNDRLSVQVHPSDEYALEVEGEFGKSECWYIMEASPDAKLILGIRDGVDKKEFEKKVRNQDFEGLFNEVRVKKGDFINISPGTVHATLEGSILLCEVQQNSDTTYRIYDFDRVVDGKKRELHIDKAMDVIDFDKKVEITDENTREKYLFEDEKGAVKIEKMLRGKYFDVDKLLIDRRYAEGMDKNFRIYSILEGKGKIVCCEKSYEIKKGDTFFIPANLDIEICGDKKIEILKTFFSKNF